MACTSQGNGPYVVAYDPGDRQWHSRWGTYSTVGSLQTAGGIVACTSQGNGPYVVAYDPGDRQWHSRWGTYSTVGSLQTAGGIVACTSQGNGPYVLAYDPGDRQWHSQWGTYSTVGSLQTAGGIVACTSQGNGPYVVAYDPGDRQCHSQWGTYSTIASLQMGGGIVACTSQGNGPYVAAYDPADRHWHSWWGGYSSVSALSIADGVVAFRAADTTHTHFAALAPRAYFAADQTTNNAPLYIQFSDNSVGGITSYWWNFGDGSGSSERSPSHKFTGFGVYTVTFQVTGPGGGHSTTMQIKTDITRPVGTLAVNGADDFTASASVTLAVSATDNSGSVASMRFGTDGSTWSSWEGYATTKELTLDSINGTRTVYAQFKDNAGNESSLCSDSIVLDTIPPVDGTLSAKGGYGNTVLYWTGFSDNLSGIAVFKLTCRTNGLPGPWPDGTLLYSGTDTVFPHTELEQGVTYSYRLTALDHAGNSSAGAVAQATPSTTADSDGDGMPDWWELQNFGGVTNAVANEDADCDGMNNLEEYIAGTNPASTQAVFRVLAAAPSSHESRVLEWVSATNRYYTIERSTNLTAGFSPIDSWILGTPPLNSYTDAAAPGALSFYRVKVSAPNVGTVNDELIDMGNGISSFFQGLLNRTNIVPHSLSIVAGFEFTDNGRGVLSSFAGRGTIDYARGTWTLTLLGPLFNGIPVTASYRFVGNE